MEEHRSIVYREFESPMGPMIGGVTEKGMCFLEWTDRGGIDRILTRVEKRYKAAPTPGGSKILDEISTELEQYFSGKLDEFKTPIDVTGTAFEQLAWKQLLRIPYGETRSYGQMATALGKKGASRAVGRANGANYLAIVIPCHRVIESSGGLGGYGGKVWRKQKLLELESGARPIDLFR